MSDYISREAAYTLAKRIVDALDTTPRVLLGRTILDFIDDIPAADVRPVVRAKWEEVGGEDEGWQYYRCTRCGAIGIANFHFCPHCGADMREPPKDGES